MAGKHIANICEQKTVKPRGLAPAEAFCLFVPRFRRIHFEHIIAERGQWLERLRGLRANASQRSHADLNEAPDLDVGNPIELGKQYARLKKRLPHLNVMRGCCGTDHRYVEQIAEACLPLLPASHEWFQYGCALKI